MPEWTTSYAPFADHWRSLQDPSVASIFDVDSAEMSYISQFTKDPQTGRLLGPFFNALRGHYLHSNL